MHMGILSYFSRAHADGNPSRCTYGLIDWPQIRSGIAAFSLQCTWVSILSSRLKMQLGILKQSCLSNAFGIPFVLLLSKCTWISFCTCVLKMHMGILYYLCRQNAHGYPLSWLKRTVQPRLKTARDRRRGSLLGPHWGRIGCSGSSERS